MSPKDKLAVGLFLMVPGIFILVTLTNPSLYVQYWLVSYEMITIASFMALPAIALIIVGGVLVLKFLVTLKAADVRIFVE